MAAAPADQIKPPTLSPKLKQLALRFVGLVLFTALLGWAQGWVAARYYSPERVAGFHTGVIQGALMPAALPTLLLGKDVPIYAPANEGRPYKIGFILGLNGCGSIFFGLALWRPQKRASTSPVRE